MNEFIAGGGGGNAYLSCTAYFHWILMDIISGDLQNENAMAVITAYTVLTMISTNAKWKINH